MPTLRELTEAIQRRPGVSAVVILGADGLLIETHDRSQSHDAEALAARVPGVMAAARQLADSSGGGGVAMLLLELDHGYGVVMRLSDQVMLFVSAAPDVALSELLFDLRQHRSAMASLL